MAVVFWIPRKINFGITRRGATTDVVVLAAGLQ